MKKYTASTELIEKLLSYGFEEDTVTTYPGHAARLKDGPYDPNHMKRHFRLPGTREQILFDYINIKLPTGESRSHLSEEELNSLITYCQLSSADRKSLKEQGYKALSIIDLVSKMDRHPEIYSNVFYKRAFIKFNELMTMNPE